MHDEFQTYYKFIYELQEDGFEYYVISFISLCISVWKDSEIVGLNLHLRVQIVGLNGFLSQLNRAH